MQPHERLIPEIAHMIPQHQNVVNRKARNYTRIARRCLRIEQSVWTLRQSKCLHRLSGQPVVSADCIGKKHLRPAIHRILHLLIKRAIHIGFNHTQLQGTQTDFPNCLKFLIVCRKIQPHFQGISHCTVRKIEDRQRFLQCFDSQLNIAKRSIPEWLITLRMMYTAPTGNAVFACWSDKCAMYSIRTVSLTRQFIYTFRQFRIAIAFCTARCKFCTAASCKRIAEISIFFHICSYFHNQRAVCGHGKHACAP